MTSDDLDNAIFDFINTIAPPPANADGEIQIFKGNQNGLIRPSGTDYTIFTMTSDVPVERKIVDYFVEPAFQNDTAATLRSGYVTMNRIPEGKENPFFEDAGSDNLAIKKESPVPFNPVNSSFRVDDNGFLVLRDDIADHDIGYVVIAPSYQFYYQIDCWGRSGRERARVLRGVFCSYKGAEFFRKYRDKYGGIGIVLSRDARNTTEPDGTNRYADCWSFDIAVTARLTIKLTQDYLTELNITLRGVL